MDTSLNTIKEMAEYSYDKILEYIIQVSISDEACDDNLQSSFKKEVMLSARNGVDASILHLFVMCNVVKMPVNNIYPKSANPGVNRDAHNQMLFPFGQIYYPENLDGMISILWTHSLNTNLRGWRPNHLCHAFQMFLMFLVLLLCHILAAQRKRR